MIARDLFAIALGVAATLVLLAAAQDDAHGEFIAECVNERPFRAESVLTAPDAPVTADEIERCRQAAKAYTGGM